MSTEPSPQASPEGSPGDSAGALGPAEHHRRHAVRLGAVVDGVTDWDAPTPVPEWRARDVVAHLAEWLPGLLAAGSDVVLPAGPSPATDPAGAWRHHADAVQQLLEDPARAGLPYRSDRLGEQSVAEVVDRLYTPDVFMHTWDLARASGQDDGLDDTVSAELLAGMRQVEELIRSSGQFGDEQPVDPAARATLRLMAFIGRDPGWRAS